MKVCEQLDEAHVTPRARRTLGLQGEIWNSSRMSSIGVAIGELRADLATPSPNDGIRPAAAVRNEQHRRTKASAV